MVGKENKELNVRDALKEGKIETLAPSLCTCGGKESLKVNLVGN